VTISRDTYIVKKIILFVVIFFFNAHIVSSQEEIRFVDGSLAAVLSIAKERNKNIFIDTYADWCKPCKRMEEKFKNRELAMFFNEHFVNYRVNMQNPVRANELRRKYDVVFLPTMYILDPNGIIKYQVDKELSVSELLNAGQRSLDPNSYYVSESTAVNRNDGTISGGNNIQTKANTTTTVVEAVITKPKAEVLPEESKVDVPMSTTSQGTNRAKYLEKFETVDESTDKILHVLGEGEMPPEILLQEAYLRLEFMDGSHISTAKEYLASQSNWDTEINRKFIFDFANSTYSKEYEYLLAHKDDFERQFGKEKVSRTLEVLTYKTLHNAVPRPSLEEAIVLYENLEEENPIKTAHYYYFNRLIAEGMDEELNRLSDNYFTKNSRDHEIRYIVGRYLKSKKDNSDSDQKKAIQLLVEAVDIYPSSLTYLDLLGEMYSSQGMPKKAQKIYKLALKEAKKQGVDSKAYESKIQTKI